MHILNYNSNKLNKLNKFNNNNHNQPSTGMLFTYLLILTGLFVLLEISFLIECSGLYFGDFQLMAHHLHVPLKIVPGVLYFIFAQLLIHVMFVVFVWMMARLVGSAFRLSLKKTETLGIVLWVIALIGILLANRYYFPNSKFSSLLLDVISLNLAKYLLIGFAVFFAGAGLVACYGLHLLLSNRSKMILAGISIVIMAVFAYQQSRHTLVTDAATEDKPNIIIIGVDSLRPDFLGFFGHRKETPHFDAFLNQATVFSESVTPIARTYSSWMSILTGEYPKINKTRTNLEDSSAVDFGITLPSQLKQHGYETIFSTDEARFSNIDKKFGFDKTITPPIGMNDFLIGSLNDFPISNLLVNTLIGEYLFPHSFGSRPVYATYEPNSFLQLLKPTLAENRKKPVLLITHFCLTHYPYAWAGLPVKKVMLHHYQSAVTRVDQQFGDYIQLLKQNNLLEHSIVILLSDHGEGVEVSGDRITSADLFIAGKNNIKRTIPHFYPPSAENESVDRSGGHGTDVLGLTQYHTVLAFQARGLHVQNQKKRIPGIVSLMDIKPTLLHFLNLPLTKTNGYSLTPEIFGHASAVNTRIDFFTESDFSPEAIRSVHPETRKVLFEGIDFFRIDPKTTRLVVKDDMLKMIISSKQFADIYHNWILALYPQNQHEMMPILVNLETGEWTNDMTTSFAEQSPAHHMLASLKQFFGSDLKTVREGG